MTKLFPALLLAAALAGCSRNEPEAPAPANDTLPEVARPTASPSPVETPKPTPSATSTPASPLPPPPEIGADEQMLDDASATSMTSRVEREQEQTEEPPVDNAGMP